MAKWGDLYEVEKNTVDWTSNRIRPSMELLMPDKFIENVKGYFDVTSRNILETMSESLNIGRSEVEIINKRSLKVTFPEGISTPYVFFKTIGPNVLNANKTHTVSFYATVIDSSLSDPSSSSYSLTAGLRNGGHEDTARTLQFNERTLFEHIFEPTNVAGNLELIIFSSSFKNNPVIIIEDVKIAETSGYDSYVPSVTEVGGLQKYQERYMSPIVERIKIPGKKIKYPLGIFLVSTPTKGEQGASITREIEAYDKLLILKEDKITERLVFQIGSSYYDCIVNTIKSSGDSKYNIERTANKLTSTKEYDPGTEKLEVINDLLSDLNYTPLHVDEYGYFNSFPYVAPVDRAVDYEYFDDELSVTHVGMQEEVDLFELPNVIQVTVSNPDIEVPLSVVVENRNKNHPRSIPSLGRRIVRFEEKEDIASEEALKAFAERLMYETSQVFGRVEFATAIMPFHGYQNVLHIKNDTLGVNEKYSEVEWKISMNPSGDNQMTHTARKTVNII